MRPQTMTSSGSTVVRGVGAPWTEDAGARSPLRGDSDTPIDIRRVPLPVGVPVEVRNRFDDRWTHGFSVAVVEEDAYQLRRLSDGSILPAWFPASMVRPDPAT